VAGRSSPPPPAGARARIAAIRAAVGERARPADDGAAALEGAVAASEVHMVDDGLVVRERMARLKAAVGDKVSNGVAHKDSPLRN
jgi:hypothetical protein